MSPFNFTSLLNRIVPARSTHGQRRRSRDRASLRLEHLEDRFAPAVTDITPGHTGTFTTIQAAVNFANTGDTIVADADTYVEQVTINKSLTLKGANAGVDPVTGTRGAESIVTGVGNGGKTPFYITASNVTIDGFTVEGATNSNQFGFGVLLGAGTSGSQVLNNIIQDNIAGLSLTNAPGGNQAVIQHNLFQNNNMSGPVSGTDIYTDQFNAGGALTNVLIDSNTFTNTSFIENAWALNIGNTGTTQFSDITFSNNDVMNHGRGVCFFGTTSSLVTGNTITGASHYAIGLFGSNGSPANSLFTISNNTLDAAGSGGAGVELINDTSASAYSGTLTLSNFGLLVVDVQQEVVKVHPGILHYGDTEVEYSNVSQVNLDNTTAVNAIPGPNTADRAAAFAGLTAEERFVQALYLDNLGRAGSKAELDQWLPVLSAGGQQAVASAMEKSFEAVDHLVKSWYVTILGRQASGGEENGFVKELLPVSAGGGGMTEEQVLSQLLSSTEFYDHAQNLVSSGKADERYVQALYQVLLDRTPGDEMAGWVSALSAGMNRQQVALAFLQSQEFRTNQFEGYYNALLHRPDESTGLNNWVMSNLDMGTVRIRFEADAEFFARG
jgi:hypothetical protein